MEAGREGPNVWSCATLVAPQPIGPRRCLSSEVRAPRAAFRPPRRSHCAPRNLPVRSLGVNSLAGAARALRTSGRGGAGAVRVCGGLARAVCSAWRSSLRGTLRRPRAVRQKGPCEGPRTRVWGTGEWVFAVHCSWSWLALAVQLLLHCCGASPRSPPTPDACTRRARKQTSEQRADPKGWHGGWGRAGAAVADRWQRCNAEARRLGGRGRKGGRTLFFCAPFFLHRTKKHGS